MLPDVVMFSSYFCDLIRSQFSMALIGEPAKPSSLHSSRNRAHRRCWHIWQRVADFGLANVQYSQDQCPEAPRFLVKVLHLDVVPFPLPPLPLLLLAPPPKLFELAVLLHAPRVSTSDRPFSKALTRFSK